MLSENQTIEIIEYELKAARAWAERHGVVIRWQPETKTIQVELVQPMTGEVFYLQGQLDNYRMFPPKWTFCNSEWSQSGKKDLFPAPAPKSSLFHPNGIICAPFNRLAYTCPEHQGLHSDWGGPVNWLNAGGVHIRASTIADMLQAIRRDLVMSRGRMRSEG